MPDVNFWQRRFAELGSHSVGPGDTQTPDQLEEHRLAFLHGARHCLSQLRGPVLDFGCGVGRWVPDLPRPYLGLDLTPEHIDMCRDKYGGLPDVEFALADRLQMLASGSFQSVFVCTVLQHIVERNLRREIVEQFHRVLAPDGMILAVEWASGQREFDWCQAVSRSDLLPLDVRAVGTVVESGRRHTIWFGNRGSSRWSKALSRWFRR